MESIIGKEGTAKAVEAYHRMKKDSAHYYIDWISLDFLGNKLYDLKRYEEARILFENNAAEFPQKDLALMSLAKTYEVLGRKQDAIIWYKKVLQISPKFEEARNRLKVLE